MSAIKCCFCLFIEHDIFLHSFFFVVDRYISHMVLHTYYWHSLKVRYAIYVIFNFSNFLLKGVCHIYDFCFWSISQSPESSVKVLFFGYFTIEFCFSRGQDDSPFDNCPLDNCLWTIHPRQFPPRIIVHRMIASQTIIPLTIAPWTITLWTIPT